MPETGEMPELAQPQTSLKQVAKSHPVTFFDTRCIQPTPFCFQPTSSRGKGEDPTPSVPLTGSQTKGHSLYFPPLDRCRKRQVKNSVDRARVSPPQAVSNIALSHTCQSSAAISSHIPAQRQGRPSVGSGLAGMLSSHKLFLEKAQRFSSQVVRLSRSSGPGVPSPSSRSGTTAGTRYGAEARGCAWRLVATFTGVQGVPTEQYPHCRHMASNCEGV